MADLVMYDTPQSAAVVRERVGDIDAAESIVCPPSRVSVWPITTGSFNRLHTSRNIFRWNRSNGCRHRAIPKSAHLKYGFDDRNVEAGFEIVAVKFL